MVESSVDALFSELETANRHILAGKRAEAILIYQDVRDKAGAEGHIQFELGRLCENLGDIDLAIEHYSSAVEAAADKARYLSILGAAQLKAGEPEQALVTLERAEAMDPQQLDLLQGLGSWYMQSGDSEKALEYLEAAHQLKPGSNTIRTNLAITLTQLNRHGQALEHARKASRSADTDPDTSYALCNILAEMGEMQEAISILEKSIRRQPDFGPAYDLLARIKKFTPGDDKFIRKSEKILDKGMPAAHRYRLHYALGKMHDDCGRYEEAFTHFQRANVLQKTDFDFARVAKRLKASRALFTAKSLQEFETFADPSAQPVFIIGMPRSGTTLIEQMIASHPEAAGAGELAEIQRIVDSIFPHKERLPTAAQLRANLTMDKAREYAGRYLSALRQGGVESSRIVDKAPNNYQYVGLLATLFPKATIIHAVRHPLDTCLSCYFQAFTELAWSNDYHSLGQIYSLYRETMDYWRAALPEVKILDVHYEQLVEDPEHEGRRMLEACGLEWNEAVLQHSQQKNIIKTASLGQARQPVYTSSKHRWINYAPHLGELADELAPYLEDDREILAGQGIKLGKGPGGWIKRLLG